jgi:UDP-glucose 4-epimerase
MILVTGARGFIGSSLVSQLRRQNKNVMSLSRSHEFGILDDKVFLDLNAVDHIRLLKKWDIVPDTVVHLAGHIEIALMRGSSDTCSVPVPGIENLSEIYKSNILSTVNLLDYCLDVGVRHMVFASSQAVYGLPASESVTEETSPNPLEHYAMSKVCCENILRLGSSRRLSVTIFRFPGVYSEKRKSGAVYRFCRSALDSGLVRAESDFPLPFDVIHLDDVLDAFSRAIESPPEGYSVFNIATGEPNNLNILAGKIAGLVPGCRVEETICPQPVICLNSTKAKRMLGWEAVPTASRLQQVLDAMQHD